MGRVNQILNTFGLASPEFSKYVSLLADLNSRLFKERSGSAVTPSEARRLEDALPSPTSTEAQNRERLKQFVSTTAEIQARLQRQYGAKVMGDVITVIDKDSGQTGVIPFDEYDPNKYEIDLNINL